MIECPQVYFLLGDFLCVWKKPSSHHDLTQLFNKYTTAKKQSLIVVKVNLQSMDTQIA